MTKPEALAAMMNACLQARPELVHGQWRMNAVDFDRLCCCIEAFHNATERTDPRLAPALTLLRELDRRGGLGEHVHDSIKAILGEEVGLGVG